MVKFSGLVFGLALSLAASQPHAGVSSDAVRNMPPNAEKIKAALTARGIISAAAPQVEQEAAVRSYLQRKFAGRDLDRGYNPLAHKRLDAAEAALNADSTSTIRGRKLGNTLTVDPSVPQWRAVASEGKLLVILVDFSKTPYTWTPQGGSSRTAAGPLHNEIPIPNNRSDLWVPNFSTTHYQDMLFTPGGWKFPLGSPRYAGERRGSMHDYFLEQSHGRYSVNGNAYGWFTVNKPEAYYGDDNPGGGTDNLLPGTPESLVSDAVAVINATSAIPWADYDTDGDCIIDHPLFIHAGIDQSGGGGAQGDDAIWAYSRSTLVKVAPKSGCPASLDGIYIYNFTIMPEDGGVGVFAHEFGHDLGLPDEYDTAYSGYGESVAFWSLMSSGSWVGWPAQTQPSDMSIWARYVLGWVTPGVTKLTDLGKGPILVRLEQAERWGGPGTYNALRVNLPQKLVYSNTPHSGAWEWWGGRADEIDTTLRRQVDLTGKSTATLSFWTWYDIEPGWDFGFVQASVDGGATWTSLPIAGTTSVHDPGAMSEIVANLPGFTGNSGGWVLKTCDLSAYKGKSILLQFRYMTDWGTTMTGFYVDDISVVADGVTLFTDNVETLDSAWTADGWSRDAGSAWKTHYYMMEWRNGAPMETPYGTTSIVNFDAGLTAIPFGFSYSVPGMLLWYRDASFTDNWTGVHPGGGFLLVVDAHKQALLGPPIPGYGIVPLNTLAQSYDATFGLLPAPSWTYLFMVDGRLVARDYQGLNALPLFDDAHSFWNQQAPVASVMTPTYGLLFRVVGQASDGSAALIGLGTK